MFSIDVNRHLNHPENGEKWEQPYWEVNDIVINRSILLFFVVFLSYIQASLETDTIKLPLPLPFSCSSSVMYKCINALIGGMRVLWVPMSSES